MASSDNVTNEKSCDFEDGAYDPDLEARLYAEIYYSNETYIPESESSIPTDTETAQNFTAVNSAEVNGQNCLPTDNFVEDCQPNSDIGTHQNSNTRTSYYPEKNWVLGDVHPGFKNQNTRKQVGTDKLRLLARKDLWLSPNNRPENRSTIQSPRGPQTGERSNTATHTNTATTVTETVENSNTTTTVTETVENSNTATAVAEQSSNHVVDLIANHSFCEPERPLKKSKKRRSLEAINQRRLKRQEKKRLRRVLAENNNGLNNAGVTMETSKYKVVSKKKKLKMKQINTEPVDISSDSDDSILEVPVPPKAPPVIIQLPDSDDDSEKVEETRPSKTKKSNVERNEESASCVNNESINSSHDESLERPTREPSPDISEEISKDAGNNERNTAEVFVEPSCPEETNLILNCTEIQRGASSLDEIRRMRDFGASVIAHSDDSMTESEANNWVNIAAAQSDCTRDEEIRSTDLSTDAINSELWDHLRQESSHQIATEVSPEMPSCSGVATSVEQPVANVEKEANATTSNEEEITSSRKRQKDPVSSPFTDFDVPAIPEKRSKRVRERTSRELSMTEYFFKPMSRELQSFYNNPWGGENMDLYDIQSRMPRNPRCWTILDADLQGPSPKRHRACPRCKTHSHYGKRCPEKPKPPCCYMCGEKGHNESRCPHTMCLTCGRKYATYRPTCGFCSKLYCNTCNSSGHSNENCPDLWRRYHSTTTEVRPSALRNTLNTMKTAQNLTCCNCAKRGHDVSTCRQLRWSQHFPTPMFINNYTRGPFYELPRPQELQDTNFSDDIILEPQHCEHIAHANPSAETFVAPARDEQIQQPVSDNNVEIIEVPDVPVVNPALSINPDHVIFESGEVGRTRSKFRVWKRLDTMQDIHLNALLAGKLMPTFLHTWQESFKFRVVITLEPVTRHIYLIIETNNAPMMEGLDRIVMQWLMRKDEEKVNLEYDTLPYDNIVEMTKNVVNKVNTFAGVQDPKKIWDKIVSAEHELKRLSARLNEITDVKKSKRQRSMYKRTVHNLLKRRALLVTSLHCGGWLKGGKSLMGRFFKISRKVTSTANQQRRIGDYLELIYLNNEMFTFHTNAALTAAWTKASLQMNNKTSATTTRTKNASERDKSTPHTNDASLPNKSIPPSQSMTGITPGTSTEISIRDDSHKSTEVSEENFSEELPNLPINDRNRLPVYCSPLASQQNIRQSTMIIDDNASGNSQISNISFETAPGNTITPSINEESSANFTKQWSAPFKPVAANGLDPLKPLPAPVVSQRRIIERVGRKDVNRNQGLVRCLTKRNRKLYKSSAKEIIKLANSTNVPHLQKMAKLLKLKMGDGSVTTEDVYKLQNAVGMKLRQSVNTGGSKASRASLKNSYDKAYQDFLATL